MKTYILTIEKTPRNPSLIAGCLSLGLEVEVFHGYDGRVIDPSEIQKMCDNSKAVAAYGRPLSRAEIGCALGHFGMVNSFLKSNQDWCLVLEDDVTVSERLLPVLECLNSIPSGTNIVNLRRQDIGPIYPPFNRKKTGPFLRTLVPPWGASSYLLSREAAILLSLCYQEKLIDSVADWPILAIPNLRFWACSTATVNIENHRSYINADRKVFQDGHAQKSNLQKLWFKIERVFNMLFVRYPIRSIYHWAILPELLRFLGRRYWLTEPSDKETSIWP